MNVRNRASAPAQATPERLRPGRHGMERADVLASQRGRMLLAVAKAVARKGYAQTTVADVLAGAGVSRATFYEHFDGKESCYAEAYKAASGLVRDALLEAAADKEPAAGLRAALHGYLAVLDDDPDLAQAFLLQSAAAGPEVQALRARAHAEWAGLLQSLARVACDQAGAPPPPALAGTCAVGALVHAVEQHLRGPLKRRRRSPFASLAGELDHALSRLLLPVGQ